MFAAQLAQVVGALAGGVAVRGLSGHRPDLGGELSDGEPLRGDRQRERRGEGGADPGYVEVDAADPGSRVLRGCGQLVEDPLGQKADVDAVEHAHEPVDHRGQPNGDLAEAVQRPAAAELLCVVHDRLEAQDALALV